MFAIVGEKDIVPLFIFPYLMKKTIVVGIYFVVAIAAIVLASCWFGQCWNFGSIASPSQQPDEQSTDT
ncbi:MAG: hypothetical protein H6765_02440 [Candidatus Peribacteria bacterium]|nr:MAG: hypothetical protein H6765_02440 [Candidatus Peribacteria bacterium]